MSKITTYTSLSAPQNDDVLPIVDVHDITMAASGTTKKVTVGALLAATSLGVFNIKTYGAVCDGATDDTTAWTNAIAAAVTAGGGVVFHPGGTSVVGGTPQVTGSNVIIRGQGDSSVILLAPSSMTANGHTIGLWVNGGSNVVIEDLCIDGNFANIAKDGGTAVPSTFAGGTGALGAAVVTAPAAGTTETWTVNAAASTASAAYSSPFAVKVDSEFVLVTGGYGTTSWTVKRGFATGNGGGATATHLNGAAIGSTHTTLFDATITAYGSGTPKTYISSSFGGGVDASTYLQYRMPIRISNAENVTVQRCLIRNSVSAGVMPDATSVNGCTDILITGNRVHHTWDNGVYFHKGVQYAAATGNLISDTMYNGVAAVYCDHILINDNNIRLAGPSFSDSGGMQVNGSSNCDVTGNLFDQCQFYGVSVQASNETNITNGAGGNEVNATTTNVAGNMITNCHAADYPAHTAPGVSFNGAVDTIVTDNTIQNCDYGISLGQKSVRATIASNRIALCASFGILNGNSADVIGTVIRGNLVTRNGNTGIYCYAPVQVVDNICAGNTNHGVQLASPPTGITRKTDYVTGNTIYDNTDSGVLVGSSAACLAVIERNTFGNSQGVLFTDGVTNGTTTFTSATAAFTAADVGSVLIITNQGTGGATTATTIASVTNGTTVVLNATPAGTQTGLTFQVGRGPSYYGDGATTTASNSVLSSATAAFTASDVGKLVVLLSLDAAPSVLGVTTVNGFTDASHVTLAADFGTIAACGFFINRSAGQMTKAVNNFNGYPVIERNNSVYGIPEYQGAAGVVNMVQPATQWLARRPVADHAYTLNKMDQLVVMTSLTASRTITLPAGFGTATLPYYVDIKDESGSCSAVNTIVLSVSGGGTVDGAASISIGTAYGRCRLYSTGTNWFTAKPPADNFAGLLTPTAVKTAGYTAAAGDFVVCDTTSGGFTVTLPAAPADLTAVAVKMVKQDTAGANLVTITAGGSDVFNAVGGSASLTLTLLFQGAVLQYQASTALWFVYSDDLALSQLDKRVGGISFPQAPFASGKHGPIPVQPAKVITEFQSGHGYTNNAGNTFTANDTADFIMGTQACKIVTGGAGATANVSNLAQTAFSTVNKVIRLRLKVDDITHMAGLNFFLGSSSLANNYKWIIQGGAASSNFVVSGQWLVVTLNWHDAVVTGSPSRSSITDVRLQVSDDATAAVTVHYQSVELVQDCSAVFPNGVVSICFDDSYESMYSLAMPKLTQYGYPAQVFTIQSLIGSGGRLTLAQLKSLQDQLGWALSSHAYLDADHSLTLTGMTAAQADLDMRQIKAWGDANGFRASAGFAYPKGQYGQTTDSQATTDVLRPYMNYARTTNSKTKETFPPADPYRLRAISDISSFSGGYAPSNLTTAATGDLDVCKTNQTWLILTFHNVVTSGPAATTDILQSDFNAIIDAINAKGIPVLTVEDVLRSLDQTYPAASVTLDTTLSDILPASTQASSLGSTGKPVDAGHAHPRYDWQPSDHGLIAWAYDPAVSVATSTALTPAGTLFLVKLHVPVAQSVTNVEMLLTTGGSGLTAGQCFAALFQGGNLLGTTADQATNWASNGKQTMAISGGPVAVAAGDVYVGFWYNGTTGPAPLRAASNSAAVNYKLAAASSRWATANTGLTTTAPGSLGTFAGQGTAYWAALS